MKTILFLLILISIKGISQNTFFIGEKNYPCTEFYNIGDENFDFSIFFINDKIGGKRMVGFTCCMEIEGNIFFYLEDNSVIKCIERNSDKVDNKYITIYYLTEQEIKKMKVSNISKIRYYISSYNMAGDDYQSCNSKGGSFTFENINVYSNIDVNYNTMVQKHIIKEEINFTKIISDFFK